MNLLQDIETKVLTLGFDAFGIAPPELPEQAAAGLEAFIAAGYHGDMGWIEARKHLRQSPRELWPEVQSIIMVGHNYAPPENPLEKLNRPHLGNISSYALGDDYHEVMKKRLKELGAWLVGHYGCEVKVFVDTAPVMEKPLAELAGLGWQGKHTNLLSREFGNWLFLGCVFTTLELAPSSSRGIAEAGISGGRTRSPTAQGATEDDVNHCGTCTACIDICPTQAIIAPNKLDARKCIAYLTIEHKGHIPVEYRKAIGNRIYGCDDCLAICPWNKFAKVSAEEKYRQRASNGSLELAELATLDDASFRKLFAKSPVKRTGRDRFIRNVCIAMGNTGDAAYLLQLEQLQKDGSELVREAAGWAVEEIRGLEKLI